MKPSIEAALRWALDHLDYVQLMLIAGIGVALFLLWKIQKDGSNGFDIADLIMRDGKASLTKLAQLGAFMTSTWGFVYLTTHGQLTEWFYTAYMLAWTGAGALNQWLGSRNQLQPPAPQGANNADPNAKE